MLKRITILLLLTISVSGCASSVLYLPQKENITNPDHARIHLTRSKAFIGGGNAFLITDSGEGASSNAIMAFDKLHTHYLGPILKSFETLSPSEKKQLSYFKIPQIGRAYNICGFNANDVRESSTDIDVKNIDNLEKSLEDIFNQSTDRLAGFDKELPSKISCPTEWGEYQLIALADKKTLGADSKIKLSFESFKELANNLKSLTGTTTSYMVVVNAEFNPLTKSSRESVTIPTKSISFKVIPVTVVGELVNGGSLTWTRPPGTLRLSRNYCALGCDKDEPESSGLGLNKEEGPVLEHKIEAGKDYYVFMDRFGTKISNKPF